MTLPAVLDHATLPGVSMPVAFGATDGIWRRGDADITQGVPFDPSAPPQMRFGPPPRPFFHVWIGGTASPGAAQAAGIYRGTIVLDVALIL